MGRKKAVNQNRLTAGGRVGDRPYFSESGRGWPRSREIS